MKKKNLFAAILFVAFVSALVSTKQAHAQEDGVYYFKTVFVAEDALGNKDTVVFVVKEGATMGVDTELGEVNLYGIEPQGDLDMRIIQRTTVNFPNGFWLQDKVLPSDENIDLKIDYRFDSTVMQPPLFPHRPYHYVLKVYAKYYPVSIYRIKNNYDPNIFHWAQFNEETGTYIAESNKTTAFQNSTFLLYTFNDAAENNLIWFQQEESVSVEEDLYNQLLYPNPCDEYIFIDGIEQQDIRIIDLNGKLISSLFIYESPFLIDTSSFYLGKYFLINNKNQFLGKFIKGEK